MHHLCSVSSFAVGIDVAAKQLVRFGVALLGVRVLLTDIQALGWAGAAVLVAGVLATIGFGRLMAAQLKLPHSLGLLSGGGTAICGISATLAIASTLPNTKDVEQHTLLCAIGITTLSTIAMVTYPLVAVFLGLSPTQAGLFLGGAIHDVAQVVGAGYIVSPEVAQSATIAKMLRVSMLMPIVLVLTLVAIRKASVQRQVVPTTRLSVLPSPASMPLFLLGFFALASLNNTVALPTELITGLNTLSTWCLVTAIAALGVKTSLAQLLELGWRPIALLLSQALFIAAWMLCGAYML